ncbi:hypothetical protein GCM10027082_48110 [Comamonas humi]
MIHELREYLLREGNWPEYRRLFVDVARRVRGDGYGRLLGAWEAQILGDADTSEAGYVRFVHLWEYDSLDERAALRKQLSRVPGWIQEFLPPAAPLIHRQYLSVLNPQHSSNVVEPLAAKTTYLHRARGMVGKAALILAQAETDANAVWTTDFPDPNEIAVLTEKPDSASLAEVRVHIQAHRVHRLTPLNPANPTLIP